jgi:hypothetical protein
MHRAWSTVAGSTANTPHQSNPFVRLGAAGHPKCWGVSTKVVSTRRDSLPRRVYSPIKQSLLNPCHQQLFRSPCEERQHTTIRSRRIQFLAAVMEAFEDTRDIVHPEVRAHVNSLVSAVRGSCGTSLVGQWTDNFRDSLVVLVPTTMADTCWETPL